MVHGKNRIPYRIDRKFTGLAGPGDDAPISLGLPFESEDCPSGESRFRWPSTQIMMSGVTKGVLLAAVVAACIVLPEGVDAREPCDGFSALSTFPVDDAPVKLVYLLAHQAGAPGSHAKAHVAGGTIVFEQPFDGIYRWPQAFDGLIYDGDRDGIDDGLTEDLRYDGHVDVVGVVVTRPSVIVLTACFPVSVGHIHGPYVVEHFGRLSTPILLPATGPVVNMSLMLLSALVLMISGAALLRKPW